MFVRYRGSADALGLFLSEFSRILLASLVILILLMWFTLNSWRQAALVIMSIPLAFSDGILMLQLLNAFVTQNLDIITMIGFVVFMGLVINNAILLASQYDSGIKNCLSQHEAIFQAIMSRKRPIYMRTVKSIFGV